jgi:hypothetical protein
MIGELSLIMRSGLLSIALFLTGCATSLDSLPVGRSPVEGWCCVRGEEPLTLEYLGAGGWLLRMGEAAILTAPFFSNPGLLDVIFGRIESDSAAIERYLPPVSDVPAVLVGHAHYDHLMDLPYILRRRAPEARLYGSRTAANLLQGDPELDPDRLVSVEESAGDSEHPGSWHMTADGRIRFMALRSGHAPHFFGIHLYQGERREPATQLPEWAGEWVEGTPLAYLIDFLSPEGEVLYRIHYQDAASTPPEGFPPPLADGIPVDLAIVCAPGYQEVRDFPEGILRRLEPRQVLVGHWESFFRSREEGEFHGVPATDLEGFLRRMEAALPVGAEWEIPLPGTTIRVAAAVSPIPPAPR